MSNLELNSLNLEETKNLMLEIGEKKFRGEQLFSFFHRNKKIDLDEMTVFSEELISDMKEKYKVNKISVYKRFDSEDECTHKFLYQLEDDNIIESVTMKYSHGNTACISTQVGCRMGCTFCASTKGGLIRNLTPAEMVGQIYEMEKDLNLTISNVVLMGSGEPLDNYENVIRFIELISHEKGHNMSKRNITLSTSGVVPNIYRLADEDIPITLSISLHSPFDKDRKEIMPVARKYSIKELMDSCRHYSSKTNRRITFEYTLIENVNDRDKDYLELVKILKGINCHINVIPLNPIKEYNRDRPEKDNIERFRDKLVKSGINTTIRREMGSDISASCGQLRRSELENI